MLHVLVDGDNIQIEQFVEHVKDEINSQFGYDYVPTIYCQSNLIVKFKSSRYTEFRFKCSRTQNKNATDAQILFDAGYILAQPGDDTIVIVSNDKIFDEIADNKNIFKMGYVGATVKRRMKPQNIINVLEMLQHEREDQSNDIYLEDLFDHFRAKSLTMFKEYINNNVKTVGIAENSTVFFRLS